MKQAMETTGKQPVPATRVTCLSCGHSRESFLYCCFNVQHSQMSNKASRDWASAYELVMGIALMIVGSSIGIAELMMGMGGIR
jgi:hypothetical protein